MTTNRNAAPGGSPVRGGKETTIPTATIAQPERTGASQSVIIEALQADGSIQQRADHLDQQTVDQYVADAGDGWPFPPVVVFRDDQDRLWLADGFHRVAAAEHLGRAEIPADVRQGSRRDAILFAVGANATHGLRRSNADKRKAVRTLLEDPEWSERPAREIARQCQVDHKTVLALRAENQSAGEFPSQAETQQDIDTPRATGNVSSQTEHRRPAEVMGSTGEIPRQSPRQQSDATVDATRENLVSPPSSEPVTRRTDNGRTIDTAPISNANRERRQVPPTTRAKATQQALNRFAGACADVRSVQLESAEVSKVAEKSCDLLIWMLPRLEKHNAADLLGKVEAAARAGGDDA